MTWGMVIFNSTVIFLSLLGLSKDICIHIDKLTDEIKKWRVEQKYDNN